MFSKFLEDNEFTEKEMEQLNDFRKENKLDSKQYMLNKTHNEICNIYIKQILADTKITDAENETLNKLMTYLGMSLSSIGFDQSTINNARKKAQRLDELEKSISKKTLPEIKSTKEEQRKIGLLMAKDEKLYFCSAAKLSKLTTRSNVPTESLEDIGVFSVTNNRIVFKGSNKIIDLPFKKIVSCEKHNKDGLTIIKSGKDKPFIIDIVDDNNEIVYRIVDFIIKNFY
ncbi:hypothetical protein NO1_1283 [Candidatus Termititenax aidoneus]|uniref:Uncharacterized protein n=1 Tax=Termititenax aidoneus TaxID=2218524 RepID=A0A388TB94_TERA1|nr:hypothetical protein NO1_1283 [Candidatus Termititenax aidoneus]